MDAITKTRALAAGLRARLAAAAESPLRFACLAVLILFGCVVVVFRPSYDTNDDVFMSMIAAGRGFCPAPDEHLIFTNVLIGQGLKSLYIHWPSLPWYGLYLLAVHYVSQVALLYCALKVGRSAATESKEVSPIESSAPRRLSRSFALPNAGRFGLYLLYFALVELPFLNSLQFTTTAFLATQAGLFLLLFAWQRSTIEPRVRVTAPLVGAVALLVIGAMIRFDSQVMAIVITLPLAVLFLRDTSLRSVVSCGLAGATAAALVVAAMAWDRASYEHDPEWQGFRAHNQLRGKFHDNAWTSYSPETAPIFAAAGWTENDHAMIAGWYSDDAELYSDARLQQIVEAHPWQSESRGARFSSRTFREMFRNRAVWSIFLALPFVVAGLGSDARAKGTILACVCVAAALILLVAWTKKSPPARVYFPLLSFPLSVALLLPSISAAARKLQKAETAAASRGKGLRLSATWRTRLAGAATIMLVVGIVMGAHRQFRRTMIVERERRQLGEFLARLPDQPTQLYICWAMPFELLPPWQMSDPLQNMPLLPLAWMQGTPWYEEAKRRHGVTHLVQAVCERPDVQLIATPEERALFARFAQEHFGADVEFVPGERVSKSVVAGSFRPSSTPSLIGEKSITARRPVRAE